MKLITTVCIITITAAVYYFLSPQIPPHISAKNIEPVHSFGNSLKITVTLSNFTPQTKTLYLPTSNLAAATTLHIDAKVALESQQNTSSSALATLELPPFSQQHYTVSLKLQETSASSYQTVRGDSAHISVSPGNHSYSISIGGYVSGKQHFSVQ